MADAPAGGTVKVPGIGRMRKKTATGLALGAVALVLGIIYYRQHHAAGGTGTAGMVADPAGNMCTVLDPNSGFCPGTAGDQQFYAGQSGLAGGGGGPGGFDASGALPSGTGGTPGPGSFTNNAQWASYCEAGMGSNGADAIAAALGKYVTGGPVNAGQVTIIDEAIAIGGYPPTQGPGGRPPSVDLAGAAHPPPPPPAGTKVTIPVTFGERAETAIGHIQRAGLVVTTNPARDPKKTYVSQGSSPEGGQKVAKGSHVVLNVRTGK